MTKMWVKSTLIDHPLKESGQAGPQPPRFGELILWLLLPCEVRTLEMEKLLKDYPKAVRRFGTRCAGLWFYFQVVFSVWPRARRLIVKIGLLTLIEEWLRRKIGA
jgi:hypothetical protein